MFCVYLNPRRPLIIDITAMMDDDQSQAEPKGADQPLTGGDPTYLDLDPKPYTTENIPDSWNGDRDPKMVPMFRQ